MQTKPGLYIVSTPIGNLNDISLRAIDTLKSSSVVFCEDTRVSQKLLEKHKINTILKVYNDNSDVQTRGFVKSLITQGKVVSLVSDAGTPLISDPGYKLVRELRNSGLHVDIIPGPSALIAALTLSGLPTDKFYFAGFIPKTTLGKEKLFSSLIQLNCSLIFYDTSPRIVDSLEVAFKIFGNRLANVSRELTKLYQESNTKTLSELIEYYQLYPPRGEIVFIIDGRDVNEISIEELEQDISKLIKQGISAKSASDKVFKRCGDKISRKEIYKIANKVKRSDKD